MKQRIVIIAAVGVLAVGIVLARREIKMKSSARSAIADLCANGGSMGKLEVQGAADRIQTAAKGLLVCGSGLERQAASLAESHAFGLKLQQDSLDGAKEFALEADSDYARKSRRERVEAEEAKLAEIRAEFAERMRALVAAHR
jgi:hypothetical protein